MALPGIHRSTQSGRQIGYFVPASCQPGEPSRERRNGGAAVDSDAEPRTS